LTTQTSEPYTGEFIELDSAPWYGYDQIEKHGDPWDAYIGTIDVDGTGCSCCENGCGGDLYDDFTDDGHRMAMRWHYMALIVVEGTVQPICEDCADAILPDIPPTDINRDCGHCLRPEDRCSDESERNCHVTQTQDGTN
jgi:hypothetical protein